MNWIIIITSILGAAALGFVYAFFRFQKSSPENSEQEAEIAQQQKELSEMNAEKSQLTERVNNLKKQYEDLSVQYQDVHKKYQESHDKNIELNQEKKSINEKLEKQEKDLNEMQKTFKEHFQNIANEILDKNSKKYAAQNQEKLDEILKPFKERINDFKETVEKNHKEELKSNTALLENIKEVNRQSQQLSEDAKRLTTAMKNDSKTQGNWGEMILEKILQSSGLRKNDEYRIEDSGVTLEGVKIRPDAIIYLPEEKNIIIDSKVSLKAYENYVNAENEQDQKLYLKNHIVSITNHIKKLSDKDYSSKVSTNSPDFILLFIPLEPSYALAMQEKPDLFNEAWDKNIIIVTPTTLLATLRTIANIWKIERQNKNAEKIAGRAGMLYDKFYNFISDMKDIKTHMDRSDKAYDSAMNRLSEGTGSLVRQTEMLKELGANTNKSLDQNLLGDDDATS